MSITALLFLLTFFGALILAVFRHPLFGLFAYIAEFYVHPPSRWWGQFLPDLRWSLLAAAVTLLAIWIRPSGQDRRTWFRTTPAQLMLLFVAWFWIESLWALDPSVNIDAAVMLTKYVLVAYMVYRLIDTPTKMTAFLLAHVAGCFYLSLLAYGADASGRLDGVGGPGIDDSNTLAMQLATGVAVASMLSLYFRGWRRVFCIVAIAFMLNAIVLTGSRSAFLALVGCGLMLYYLRPVAYKKTFHVYAVLGIILFGYVASTGFWKRMDTVMVAATGTEEQMDISARSRIEMIKAQAQMVPRCVFGCGHRGSEILSHQYLDEQYMSNAGGRSSHNVFMTVLVEQGIPGVIIFFWIVGWTGSTLQKLKREGTVPQPTRTQTTFAVHVAAVGGALMVVLIGGMFVDFSQCEVQIWMIALLASLTRLSARNKDLTLSDRSPLQAGTVPPRMPEAFRYTRNPE